MKYTLVYITVGNLPEAEKISEYLLSHRLAACTNILPKTHAAYWWEGKIVREEEVVLLVKTRSELFTKIEQEVRKINSYSVPCIIALPIEQGFDKFLNWIDETTQDQPTTENQ